MKSKSELIQHCEKALQENWQYVFGAKGSVLTRQQIQDKQNRWGKKCVYDSDLNKAGKICCDCSGLISSLTGIERNSQGYFDSAIEKKGINERNASMIGWGLWKKGHIGVYDGNDGYYAMDNSDRNMVHNNLNQNSFTHIIKLCDINYGK